MISPNIFSASGPVNSGPLAPRKKPGFGSSLASSASGQSVWWARIGHLPGAVSSAPVSPPSREDHHDVALVRRVVDAQQRLAARGHHVGRGGAVPELGERDFVLGRDDAFGREVVQVERLARAVRTGEAIGQRRSRGLAVCVREVC